MACDVALVSDIALVPFPGGTSGATDHNVTPLTTFDWLGKLNRLRSPSVSTLPSDWATSLAISSNGLRTRRPLSSRDITPAVHAPIDLTALHSRSYGTDSRAMAFGIRLLTANRLRPYLPKQTSRVASGASRR